MSMNEFQRETLDVVKDLLIEHKAAQEGRFVNIEKLAAKNSELLGNLIVGGAGAPSKQAGMPRDEYEKHARAFFGRVLRREPSDSEVDYSALEEYSNAFPHWLRRGDAISGSFQNAMRIGSDPAGGFWTPPEFSRNIFSRLFETSPMRQVASTLTIDADSIEFPLDVNDAVSGGWVGENDSRAETDTPDVGLQTIYLREQYAMPKVTQRLLDMSGLDIEGWLQDKIADKISRTENTAFVSGDGVIKPRGFLDYSSSSVTTDDGSRDWGVVQHVVTGAAGGFPTVSGSTADDPDALITLKSKLKADYLPRARWMMNRASAAVVRKLKDKDGRYLWTDSLQQGQPDMLLGHGVILAEDMPDFGANAFPIAFGDFSRYLILDHRSGFRLLRDAVTTKGQVKFYTYRYAGGDIRDFDAIKLLKASA